MQNHTHSDSAQQAQMDEIRSVLTRLLAEAAPPSASISLTDDVDLLSSGILDSLSMVNLSMRLADEFGFELTDDDFTEENFSTFGALVNLVSRKRNN